MRYTQFLIFEAGTACQLAAEHAACPSSDPQRYSGIDCSRPVRDEQIIAIAAEAYRTHGFRGCIGWHYYNEPLLQWTRIRRLMREIRRYVPESRFVLWTNGEALPEDASELQQFDLIYASDYQRNGLPLLKEAAPHTNILHITHDARRQQPRVESDAPCARQYTELIVDYYGRVHLCCFDWWGGAAMGNVHDWPFAEIVRHWRQVRSRVAGERMAPEAPQRCLTCGMRSLHVPNFLPEVRADAQIHRQSADAAESESEPGGVPDRTDDRVPYWGQVADYYRPCAIRHRKLAPEAYPQRFRLFATVGTWHEADVIEANVKHLLTQGCDEVWIVDNDSPDGTCERALAAGARIGEIYRTRFYREAVRLYRTNLLARRLVEQAGEDAWWLSIDADEFPQGPRGLTLREYLEELGSHYDCVGAVGFDHYPSGEPENVPGVHPAEFQPYGHIRDCCGGAYYWKHPLLWFPRGVFDACQSRGMHRPYGPPARRDLIAPIEAMLIHHVPFRCRDATFRRLRVLCEPTAALNGEHRSVTDDRDIGGQGAIKRYRQLELIYARRWDEVEPAHNQSWGGNWPPVRHWSEVLSEAEYRWRRWYGAEKVQMAENAR